jgi:hypothetical protein
MSSPGTSKTSRPMSPLSKDYHTSESQMETNDLMRSTLTDECRTEKGDQKTCMICGFTHFWRPIPCRGHLGLPGSRKLVQLCKPYPEHCDRFSEVVRELKERNTQTDQAAKEVTKRSLESGTPGDVIIVDNFCKKARVSNDRPFKIVRTRDEVDMQWARADVSAGLPMSFFDNKEVHKAVRMTSECGENYIRTKPGGAKETTLPHSPRCIDWHMVLSSESSCLRCHDGLVYRCTRFPQTGGQISTFPL